MRVWCYIGSNGRICADSGFRDEAEAWRVMLGWPDESDIAAAKARGDKVRLINLSLVHEREPPHCPTCGCRSPPPER